MCTSAIVCVCVRAFHQGSSLRAAAGQVPYSRCNTYSRPGCVVHKTGAELIVFVWRRKNRTLPDDWDCCRHAAKVQHKRGGRLARKECACVRDREGEGDTDQVSVRVSVHIKLFCSQCEWTSSPDNPISSSCRTSLHLTCSRVQFQGEVQPEVDFLHETCIVW